jgi:hypothetical protein
MPELNKTILKDSANLKAYYRLEGDLTDSSSSGYDLTNGGSTDQASGKYGRGRSFVSASSQYASVSAANLRIAGSQSFAAWVYPTANSTIQGRIAAVSDSTPTNYACITTGVGAANVFSIQVSGLTPSQVTSTTVFSLNTWYHVVGVYDSSGATLRIYVNGTCEASSSVTGSHTAGTGGFAIGRLGDYTATTTYFDGILDDVAVFNTALSADQIKELYEGRYIGEGWPQTGLVGGWHLNGNSTDYSGNSNNGTDTAITYSLANGKFGQGAGFNGSSSKIVRANASLTGIKTTGAQTWGAWIQIATTTGALTIMGRSNAGASQLLRLAINATGAAGTSDAYFQITGLTPSQVNSTFYLSANTWYFVVGIYTGSALQIYVNGKLELSSSVTGTPNNPTSQFGIGILGDYTGFQYHNGKIDEAFVFNIAKDANWVRKQYALGTGKFY